MDAPGAQQQIEPILRFANEALGPASQRALTDPARQALVLARVRQGAGLEDAILAEVHGLAPRSPAVANEFLGHFLTELQQLARPLLSQPLRRFVDSSDLVQSVLGNTFEELWGLEFRTRSQFLAYLVQRLHWKAAQRGRTKEMRRRRSEPPAHPAGEKIEPSPGPSTQLAMAEDEERLLLTLLRLPKRDRDIVKIRLAGGTIQQVMAKTGLNYEAARKASLRALQRARELVSLEEHSRGQESQGDSRQ